MTTQTKIPTKDEIKRKERGLPPVNPSDAPKIKLSRGGGEVVLNDVGQRMGHTFVRLPADVSLEDVQRDPKVWSLVQESEFALRKFSLVTIVAHDESRCLHSWVVVHADRQSAVVRPNRGGFIDMTTQDDEWEDEHVKAKWGGSDLWGIYRKSDGVRLSGGHASVEAAKVAYLTTLPRKMVA
jgi:hypothetical protein